MGIFSYHYDDEKNFKSNQDFIAKVPQVGSIVDLAPRDNGKTMDFFSFIWSTLNMDQTRLNLNGTFEKFGLSRSISFGFKINRCL